MRKINKNLFLFVGLISIVGISSFFLLQKLFPLISHITYYCQSFMDALSSPIPYYFALIPFILFSSFLLTAIIKLFVVYAKVQLFKKKLLKNYSGTKNLALLLQKLQLTNKVFLVESEKHFAFCLGIRNPKIYMSTTLTELLTASEIEAVLRHEKYHLDNKDTLIMLIASVGESLLPFFPLLSDFLHNYRIEREIKADEQSIQGLGDKKPLISVLKKLLTVPSFTMTTASAIADHHTLEPRINALIKKGIPVKTFRIKNVLISFCSIVLMSTIAIAPVQAVEIHHQGEDVMMICPNNDECMNACKQAYSPKKKNYSEAHMYSPVK